MQKEFESVEQWMIQTIKKDGAVDVYDYRAKFGKAAHLSWFYKIARMLKLKKIKKLPDGTPLDFSRWTSTGLPEGKMLHTSILTRHIQPIAFSSLFIDQLGYEEDAPKTERYRIIIESKAGKRNSRLSGLSKSWIANLHEYKIGNEYRIPIEKLLITKVEKPASYVPCREHLAKDVGAIKVEVESKGHTPPLIHIMKFWALTENIPQVGKKTEEIFNARNVKLSTVQKDTICHQMCEVKKD